MSTVRDTIGTSVYFMTYESSKQILANARGNSPTTPMAVVVAGGLCGIASWIVVGTLDSTRSTCRRSDHYLQIYPIDSAKAIYQKNILAGNPPAPSPIEFWNRRMYHGPLLPLRAKSPYLPKLTRDAGLGVSIARSCLINAIFFSVFEFSKKRINKLEIDDE